MDFIETNELQDQKGMLLSEILHLTKEKERLDKIIEIHEGKTKKEEGMAEKIAAKQEVINELNKKINSLNIEKVSLDRKCNALKATIEEKEEIAEEIEKHKKMFNDLKQDLKDFELKHSILKSEAEEGTRIAKKKLEDMHQTIESLGIFTNDIINKLL